MKKGGLLEELEMKINASNSINFDYENEIKKLENWNSQLNYEYEISYKVFYEDQHLTPIKFQQLADYRQIIIDQITKNNYKIEEIKKCLKSQQKIHLLLTKCYYMIDNCSLY